MPINPSISLGARVPDFSGIIPGAINTYNAVKGIRERSEARKADKFKQSQIERILSQPRTGDIGENIQIGESLLQYNQEFRTSADRIRPKETGYENAANAAEATADRAYQKPAYSSFRGIFQI